MGPVQLISTQQPMVAKCIIKDKEKLDVCTLDGQQRRSMTFQVARVKKALGSVPVPPETYAVVFFGGG